MALADDPLKFLDGLRSLLLTRTCCWLLEPTWALSRADEEEEEAACSAEAASADRLAAIELIAEALIPKVPVRVTTTTGRGLIDLTGCKSWLETAGACTAEAEFCWAAADWSPPMSSLEAADACCLSVGLIILDLLGRLERSAADGASELSATKLGLTVTWPGLLELRCTGLFAD